MNRCVVGFGNRVMNLMRLALGLWILLAGAGVVAHGATSVKLGSIRQITGPQDLDLEGDIVYAINFSANDPARVVRGITFLPDRLGIPGATLVGPQQVSPWQTKPEFGVSVDANELEEILQDIRWANSGSGERLRAALAVRSGEEYKLQILISGNGAENRRWDIRVNGREAVDEITSLGSSPGQTYSRSRATLYTYQFASTASSVVVEMGSLFGANEGGDRNPIWQALTLEKVTVPPTPDDVVLEPSKFFPSQTLSIGRLRAIDRKFAATHIFSFATGAGDTDNTKFTLAGADLHPRPYNFLTEAPGTTYSVRVRGADATDPARFIESALAVQLVASHAPTAIMLDASSISAAALPGHTVAGLQAADSDEFDGHVFQFVAGPGDDHNALFKITAGVLVLAVPLPAGATIARFRLRATDRAGLRVEAVFELPVIEPHVRLNEIMAGKVGGVPNEKNDPQEWIEVRNDLPQSVGLTGWYLTDDPQNLRQWKFPERRLGPNEFLLILADGTGSPVSGSSILHANFSLDTDGEWVALVRPDGVTIASEWRFPNQFPGVSYGYGADDSLGYLTISTPGKANGTTAGAGENAVTFSRPHGFHTQAFPLELKAARPGSTIHYTLDGTRPTATTGTVYSGPINVTPNTSGTTRGLRIVRAIAVNPTAAYSPVATQTYLFINGVSGPTVDGVVGQSQLQTSITRHAVYGPLIDDAFLALPAVSVVVSGSVNATERLASVELVDPLNLEPGFQVDCGIEGTGTSSFGSPKASMAAKFRFDYGQSRLRYPVFARGSMAPGQAATQFKELRLRSHSHDTFYWLGTRENPPTPYGNPPVTRSGDAQLVRNPWIDEMQILMGQPGKHGRQVHMFLNGAYHGIYHIHEHPDEDFMASYVPGSADDFHFTGGATTGSEHANGDSWQSAWASVKSSLGNYQQAKRWVDVTNLCDYMILSFYAGNDWDWSSQHNWGAAGPRFPDRGGWKFFQQDSDITLQDVAADCTDQDAPDGIFTRLMSYADFRVLFRDRVYKHCFGEGVLTPAKAGALYEARMNEIATAIVAETARRQPSSSVAPLPWDRDQEWTNEWKYLRNTFFPQRTTRLIEQLRKHSGWWPMAPPVLNASGGGVPAGFEVTFTVATGRAYFTTDGSDPRLPGGAVNPAARSAAGGVVAVIDRPLVVKARVYTGTDWSALVESYFSPEGTPAASAENLVLSEIHFHPMDQPGTEFLEILNTSERTVDLSDVVITNAVNFKFPKPSLIGSGVRVVVVKDLAIFAGLYGDARSPFFQGSVRVFGPWSGSLSNEGETIEFLAASGAPIFSCSFSTDAAWPGRADGRGSSLELESPREAPLTSAAKSAWLSDALHWRPSSQFHGSPGADGSEVRGPIVINELMVAPPAGGQDGVELLNLTGETVALGGWFLSDSWSNYRKYRFPDGTTIGPGSRFVLQASDFDNPANQASLTPFGLNDQGDNLFLVEAASDGTLVRFVDTLTFGPTPSGVSIGRYPDGTGSFVRLQEATLGSTNSAAQPGYQAWASTAFTAGTAAELTGPDADPDGDGLTNFAEYAFGSSPNHLDPAPLQARGGSAEKGFTFTYRRRTSALGLRYRIESSVDLKRWDVPVGGVEILSETAKPDGSTQVEARLIPVPGEDASVLFVRLAVESQ